jgi:hypothetical protein
MRKSSGLTWDVETVPFITMPQLHKLAQGRPTANGQAARRAAGEWSSPNHRAIVRNDTLDVLGTWSDEGEPWTNQQGFAFAEALLGELLPRRCSRSARAATSACSSSSPSTSPSAATSCVVPLRPPRPHRPGRGADHVHQRPRAVRQHRPHGHPGGPARDGIIRIRHIGNLSEQVHEARQMPRPRVDYAKQFKKFGDRLAKQKLAERKLARSSTSSGRPLGRQAGLKNADERRELMLAIFRGDTSHEKVDIDTTGNAPGTKWCAYNALVEYDQHYSRVVVGKDTSDPERAAAERRFVRATEDPNRIQSRALDLIVAA